MQGILHRLASLKLARGTAARKLLTSALLAAMAAQANAQTVTVTASPTTIPAGGTSTLTWSTTNVSSCTYDGLAWPTSGSQAVSPPATKTFTLTCLPKTGTNTVSGSAKVTVNTALPTVTASASPTSLTQGQSSTITWSSTNATSCSYEGSSWPLSGSRVVTPTATKTHTLTCSNAKGSTSRSVTVTVASAPVAAAPTVTASVSPTSVPLNTTAKLTWSSSNATACNQGGISGTKNVGPYTSTGTKNITVTCTGAGGSTSKTVSLSVTQTAGQCPTNYSVAPSNMQSLAVGSYYYKVTGAAGTGWGTDFYTDDSSIGAMAVHAGIVSIGGSAIIRVDKSAGRSSYTGSTRNGITTSSYGSWGGTYTVALHQSCGAGAVDTTPDAFSFSASSNQPWNTQVVSSPVTVKGFDGSLTASVTGDSTARISKDGSTWATQVSVVSGESLRVRMTSANTPGTQRSATVSLGGVNATWSVTTAASGGGSSANWMKVSASSEGATLVNGEIRIRQRDKLQLIVTTTAPASCTASTTTSGTNKSISFSTEGSGMGMAVSLPKFYFLSLRQTMTVSCSRPGATADTVSFTVRLSELGGSGALPQVTSASLTSLSGTNLNGRSFSLDTPVKVSWSSTNASACYIKDRPQEYLPNNTGTELPPYYFGKPGAYEFEFFCVNDAGMSDTRTISFTVTAPATSTAIKPGFRGEYTVNAIQVNGDGKPDLHVKPAGGNTTSGVSEFVLVSQPKNNGYTVSRVQSGWNTAAVLQAGIELLLSDIDVDGHSDMIIKNIRGANDLIVYAPNVARGIPGGFGENGYAVMDQNFKTFFEDLYNIIINPRYLDSHTYHHSQTIVYHMPIGGLGDCVGDIVAGPYDVAVCEDALGLGVTFPVFDNVVTLYKVVEIVNGMPDYTLWLPETNNLRCILWCNGRSGIFDTGRIVGGSEEARRLSDSLSAILRRPFMRNVLMANYAVSPVDGSYPSSLEEGRRNNFELAILTILGIVLGQDQGCRVMDRVASGDFDCEFFASVGASGGLPAGDLSISAEERGFAQRGERQKFWESRKAKGDPVADIALAVVKNTFDPKDPTVSSLALETNSRLQPYLDKVYAAGGPRLVLEDVGVAVMKQHIVAVDNDVARKIGAKPGALSVDQVDAYHIEAFESIGVPGNAYGGKAYFGLVPGFLYCPKCDPSSTPQN